MIKDQGVADLTILIAGSHSAGPKLPGHLSCTDHCTAVVTLSTEMQMGNMTGAQLN